MLSATLRSGQSGPRDRVPRTADCRGERNSTVMSDAGALVRFVRETVAREHAHTA